MREIIKNKVFKKKNEFKFFVPVCVLKKKGKMKNEEAVKRKKIVHKLKHQLKTNWFISWWTLFALLLGIAGITVGSLALSRVNAITPTPTPVPNTGFLTVTDHQVIVVNNLNLLPQAGDNDIITIVVTNNQNVRDRKSVV